MTDDLSNENDYVIFYNKYQEEDKKVFFLNNQGCNNLDLR